MFVEQKQISSQKTFWFKDLGTKKDLSVTESHTQL